MIHQTVGVYGNGDTKLNGVDSKYLASHIEYNLRMRPGRAFFVDGVCLNKAFLADKGIENVKIKIESLDKPTNDTSPYV